MKLLNSLNSIKSPLFDPNLLNSPYTTISGISNPYLTLIAWSSIIVNNPLFSVSYSTNISFILYSSITPLVFPINFSLKSFTKSSITHSGGIIASSLIPHVSVNILTKFSSFPTALDISV